MDCRHMVAMDSTTYIYWQDNGQWLGYLHDYPDYWTQGSPSKTYSPIFAICTSMSQGAVPQ